MGSSTLSLLVLRVLTDDPDDPLPADDLALAAYALHRCSNFHGEPFLWWLSGEVAE
jgi:hypothetical protein